MKRSTSTKQTKVTKPKRSKKSCSKEIKTHPQLPAGAFLFMAEDGLERPLPVLHLGVREIGLQRLRENYRPESRRDV